jgi:hypothetical protein
MKNLLSFNEFVNEHYNAEETTVVEATDADGFNPTTTTDADPTEAAIKSTEELVPGTEYVVDGKKDMLYQGVTDGVYVFNGEEKAEAVQFNEEEMAALVSGGKVAAVKGL